MYPFGDGDDKYQIPTGEGRKLALSTSQLMDVFNYPILPEEEKWRDLWVFSFYCAGANLSDILRFRYENIKGNVIEWYRQKTNKKGKTKPRQLRAIITPEMQMIIDEYGNERKTANFIFPYLSYGLTPTREREIIQLVVHNVNRKMKKIGDALGIEKLTSYAARHSFASISRRAGVALFEISKSMGHATLKTTEIYLDSLNVDELIVNSQKLPRRQQIVNK
jgi:integrase